MIFQTTDIPRMLPELMLLVLALLVLGSDVLERWGSEPAAIRERALASANLAATGLAMVLVIALVQSRLLFTVPEPIGNPVVDVLINIGRNLQLGGAAGPPILSAFAVDGMTHIGRLLLIGSALLAVLLTRDRPPLAQPGEFYSLILFAVLGMCLMAGAVEFILMFLALELSSLALYVLAGYTREHRASSEAGLKYFLFGVTSSAVLLYGIALTYGFVVSQARPGDLVISTLFSKVAAAVSVASVESRPLLILAMLLVIGGVSYKIAAVPFHSWAPDVYQGAPGPVVALLASASKVAGFLLLYRLLGTAFPGAAGTPSVAAFEGWTAILSVIALLTLLVGNLGALPQRNARRMLAYSSIGHAGFLLLGMLLQLPNASGQQFGTASFLYYLGTYALTSIVVFGALDAAARITGGDDIDDLRGLWQRSPLLTIVLTLALASLAGLPPLAGFWAKFFVFVGAWQAGAGWAVAVALALTVVALGYYARILRTMWMTDPAADAAPIATLPTQRAALIVAAALVLALGLFPNLVWGALEGAVLVAER